MATASLRAMPDYLIVGGKRCGSTSLQRHLAAHPYVVPPHTGKGTHYFDENFTKGEEWFRAHYPLKITLAARAKHLRHHAITGEASPYYAYHPVGLDRIHDCLPGVRLIFVLRNPIERAYSEWRYATRRGIERLDIHAALDAETDRLCGEEERLRADPAYVSWNHRHYSYIARGLYADQLRHCMRLFPRSSIHVTEFSGLFSSNTDAFDAICHFLGIPSSTDDTMPHLEAGGTVVTVPTSVRQRLVPVFEESNTWLGQEFGVAFQ